jgi:uncharacterized protein
MPRVVLDTNVVVSALLKRGGLPDQVLRLALAEKLQLCVSQAVLTEYARVLPRPRFALRPEEVTTTLAKIRAVGFMVHPTKTLAIAPHEPDNRFLECADASGADFLITGNLRHFPRSHKATLIVNARQLFALLDPEQI